MLLNFPSARLSEQYQGIHQPTIYPCPAKGGIKCAHPQSLLWVMGLLFQGFSKGNIRVANPTNDNVV